MGARGTSGLFTGMHKRPRSLLVAKGNKEKTGRCQMKQTHARLTLPAARDPALEKNRTMLRKTRS